MRENKSPAFQFYPKDFLTDGNVVTMTNEEKGEYITLLCLDWINNGITEPMLKGGSPLVQRCFNQKGEKWYNPRLEAERQKQNKWREKSAAGGRASGKARKQKSFSIEPHLKGGCQMVEPKGNSSSSSAFSNKEKEKKKKKTAPRDFEKSSSPPEKIKPRPNPVNADGVKLRDLEDDEFETLIDPEVGFNAMQEMRSKMGKKE